MSVSCQSRHHHHQQQQQHHQHQQHQPRHYCAIAMSPHCAVTSPRTRRSPCEHVRLSSSVARPRSGVWSERHYWLDVAAQ
ncbi:unnamed protein product [Lampetra fluviatilis]